LLLSTDERIGFSNIVTSYENGVATCSFTRTLTMPSVTNYFDLNKSYYILAAYGPVKSDLPGFHTFYKSSTSMFSFKNEIIIQTTLPPATQITSSTFIDNFSIDTIKISWKDNGDSFIDNFSIDTIKISWKDNGDSTNITMTNTMTKYNWFAFGFSNDQSMVNIHILKNQF